MKDKITILAKKHGFRARSIYKLQQIDNKFNLIKPNDSVLDLGSYPGSWLQYLTQKTQGFILGVDIKQINKIKGIKLLKADIEKPETINKIKELKEKFDVVISDAAPKTTGIQEIDTQNSYDICKATLNIALKLLKNKGNYLTKMYQSELTEDFIKETKQYFHKVQTFRPITTKKRSKEVFIIAKGLKV